MKTISVSILERFDEIYRILTHEEERIAMPAREKLLEIVQNTSFKMFDETDEYLDNVRAQGYPNYVSPTFGSHAFRVYYNSYSRKIYVDLNRDPIAAIRISLETEVQVLCEIIRSMVLVDPTLDIDAEPEFLP